MEALGRLDDRLADDRLCADLYRAVTNRSLSMRAPRAEGHLALSRRRAEEIVNTVRAAHAQPPLTGLAQSGGEGELSDRAGAVLSGSAYTSSDQRSKMGKAQLIRAVGQKRRQRSS